MKHNRWMVQAILQIEQSAVSPGPGVSMIGVGGLPVTLTSISNIGVTKYTFTILDAPLDSGIVTPLVLASGSSDTTDFTPDLPETPGCYRLQLSVVGENGCVDSQIRNFAVPTPEGWILPSFKSKAAELNFPGITEGWQELLNRIFLSLSGGGGTDELVKASAADTTASTLLAKVAAGTGITLSLLNPGLNEQLEIASSGGCALCPLAGTTAVRLALAAPADGQIFTDTDNPASYIYRAGSWVAI